MRKLFVALFILVNSPQVFATAANSCKTSFYTESKEIPGSYVGVVGGVRRGNLHNQREAEDCWAHVLTELIEAYHASLNPKSNIKLSAEYDLFWHIYFQMRIHLKKFERIRREKNKPDNQLAYGLGKSHVIELKKGFQILSAGSEKEALQGLNFTGVMPVVRYNQPIKTDEMDQRLANGIGHFIGNYILKGKNIEAYSRSNDDPSDGVNTALYNDLVTSLMSHERVLTQVPLRPNQEFKYKGRVTTPRKFLRDDIGFRAEEYMSFKARIGTEKLSLKAIVESVKTYGIPVPIDINIFGDGEIWDREQDEGLFSEKICGDNCKGFTGRHEVLVVNFLFAGDDDETPTALIVQNSWWHTGNRDVNGNKTRNPKKSGYYLLTLNYLNRGQNRSPWNFILNKKVVDGNKEFLGLTPE